MFLDVKAAYYSLVSGFAFEQVQNDEQDKWGSCLQSGVVLVGHSMGGALAARVAEARVDGLAGLVVIDVVEGTALDALAGMQTVLR